MESLKEYRQVVNYLNGLNNLRPPGLYLYPAKDPSQFVKKTRDFLARLGDPAKKIKFIHVAGTSGKGTVSSKIAAALYNAGNKTGLFTSPYVQEPIEEISVNGKYISPGVFARIVLKLKPLIDKLYTSGKFGGPTYFEIFLVTALLYFKEQKCDWVVLETGLGGRFDATNFVKPELSVITNIGLDHTQILGKTVKKIAWEKAGIIKHGVPVFTSEKKSAALKIIREEAKEKNSDPYQTADLPTAVAKYLAISKVSARSQLHAKLPARLEIMQKNPLVILDGAHNPDKIKFLKDKLKTFRYKNLVLIFAAAADKDSKSMAKILAPLSKKVFVTHFQSPRPATTPRDLAIYFKNYTKKGTTIKQFLDSKDALSESLKTASNKDLILITGSFYLAGELRSHWHPNSKLLKSRSS